MRLSSTYGERRLSDSRSSTAQPGADICTEYRSTSSSTLPESGFNLRAECRRFGSLARCYTAQKQQASSDCQLTSARFQSDHLSICTRVHIYLSDKAPARTLYRSKVFRYGYCEYEVACGIAPYPRGTSLDLRTL